MDSTRVAPVRIVLAVALAVCMSESVRAETAERFAFEWTADAGSVGSAQSSHVNEPYVVEFLQQQVEVPDASAAQALLRRHGILLSNEAMPWSPERAHLVLATLRGLPRNVVPRGSGVQSKWILESAQVADDVEITRRDDGSVVRIGVDAFTYAAPRDALIDGRFGRLHSRRLHNAVVRYLTDQGEDRDAVESILNDRYGVSIAVPDYTRLTRSTTGETIASFQQFHAQERMQLLEQLEELPPTLQWTERPIYLVRRADGTAHPLYPVAPAVSWPNLEDGYIEFMEHAFTSSFLEHTQRLILHERAHFLWTRALSDELKAEWIELGEWYEDPDRPTGWSCGGTTEFVSRHAHAVNPAEDLAETLAYFVINPDKLRSRSIAKYELIRDAVMESNIYLSRVRDDLTFEVQNLLPDYVYPGNIRRVTIHVDGEPRQDKVVTIELEIDSTGRFDAASSASMRLTSGIDTYLDLHLAPVDRDGRRAEVGSILRGRLELSRYAKSGYWWPGQISITDSHGNQRFAGPGDYGWKLYVDNPLDRPGRHGNLARRREPRDEGARGLQRHPGESRCRSVQLHAVRAVR